MNYLTSANIYNFNADKVMMKLANNDWPGCWDYLFEVLQNFTVAANINFNLSLQTDLRDIEKQKKINEFAALFGELFLALLIDPASKIPDKNFSDLINVHETLHTLLYLVRLDTTDEAITDILESQKQLSETQQKKLLLLLSLNTQLDIPTIFKKVDTKYRIPAVTSFLSYMKVLNERSYDNKVALYAFQHDLEKSSQDFKTFLRAINVYFTCSYMNITSRHVIKKCVNTAVQRYLLNKKRELQQIRNMPPMTWNLIPAGNTKPVLFILLEEFANGHAMNRSWKDWIKTLGSTFHNVLLISNKKADSSIHEEFDHVMTFDNIGEIIKVSHDLKPDLIIMPSVGMDFSIILASNMRLAPLQIMGLGHPATTMSPFIDFVYGGEKLYHQDAFPNDRYIADDSPYRFTPNMSKERIMGLNIPQRAKGDQSPLRIGIVGSNLKISYPFIRLLKELVSQSKYPLHFSFHLGTIGIDSLFIEKYLTGQFSHITYYGWQNYDDYIDSMKCTDIILNPVPFGHTNTIIDSLLLGKPCIGLIGNEPASRTESYILDIVGLTNKFVANDISDYIKKFNFYADCIMNGETTFYDRGKIYDLLYAEEQSSDFGKVIKWIYDNHDILKSSGRQKFTVFEDLK